MKAAAAPLHLHASLDEHVCNPLVRPGPSSFSSSSIPLSIFLQVTFNPKQPISDSLILRGIAMLMRAGRQASTFSPARYRRCCWVGGRLVGSLRLQIKSHLPLYVSFPPDCNLSPPGFTVGGKDVSLKKKKRK